MSDTMTFRSIGARDVPGFREQYLKLLAGDFRGIPYISPEQAHQMSYGDWRNSLEEMSETVKNPRMANLYGAYLSHPDGKLGPLMAAARIGVEYPGDRLDRGPYYQKLGMAALKVGLWPGDLQVFAYAANPAIRDLQPKKDNEVFGRLVFEAMEDYPDVQTVSTFCDTSNKILRARMAALAGGDSNMIVGRREVEISVGGINRACRRLKSPLPNWGDLAILGINRDNYYDMRGGK